MSENVSTTTTLVRIVVSKSSSVLLRNFVFIRMQILAT